MPAHSGGEATSDSDAGVWSSSEVEGFCSTGSMAEMSATSLVVSALYKSQPDFSVS